MNAAAPWLGAAVLVGSGLAAGTWLVLDAAVFSRVHRLGDRVAAQLGPSSAVPGRRSAALLARIWPMGAEQRVRLETKLADAGRRPDALHHRSTTVLWCALIGAAMGVVFTLAATIGTLRPMPAVVAFLGAIVGTAAWRSTSLTRAVTRRRRHAAAQFPLLADLLALGVAAGDGVGPSLDRAAAEVGGPLGERVEAALRRSAAGVPLTTCLHEMASAARVPTLSECVEAITVAGERGTPLASVLRDQASDAREAERRELLEAGGKAEISMMVPVVFGLLPISVLFAAFPSLDLLSLSL